jgi:Fic family protein
MQELFEDISELLNKKLNIEEIFYYSSLIHLIFVHIHPFAD